MPLSDIIDEKKLVYCSPDTVVLEVAQIMKARDVGAVLILEDNRPVGIVTDRDLTLRVLCDGLDASSTPIDQIMTRSVETACESDGLYRVIALMKENKIRRVPVVDKSGNAVALVSFGDVYRLLVRELDDLTEDTPEDLKLAVAA